MSEKFDCVKCNKSLVRIKSGITKDGKNALKYVDEQNRPWNTKTCPDCHKIQIKNSRLKRKLKELDI